MPSEAVVKDPDAARELAERYQTTGNADFLIRANAASYDANARAAAAISVDKERTADTDLSTAASEADVDEDSIRAYAVRGPYLVVVYEDARGDHKKKAIHLGGGGPAPQLSEEERANRAVEQVEAETLRERARIVAEAEKAKEEAARKADEEASEKSSEVEEGLSEKQQKAVEQAKEEKPRRQRRERVQRRDQGGQVQSE